MLALRRWVVVARPMFSPWDTSRPTYRGSSSSSVTPRVAKAHRERANLTRQLSKIGAATRIGCHPATRRTSPTPLDAWETSSSTSFPRPSDDRSHCTREEGHACVTEFRITLSKTLSHGGGESHVVTTAWREKEEHLHRKISSHDGGGTPRGDHHVARRTWRCGDSIFT